MPNVNQHRYAGRPGTQGGCRPFVLVVVGVLFCTGCGFGGKPVPATAPDTSPTTPVTTPATNPAPPTKPTPTPNDTTPKPTAPASPTSLTAATLAQKFRTHGGKVVTVDGVVESAVAVSAGTNVMLATSPGFPKVRLLFPKGRWTGDLPTNGGTVSAKGTVTKAVTATTFVDVSDCELVLHTPATPDEGIAVTAVEVTAEFEKDLKAAEAKYKNKLLRVTGTVLRASDAGKSAGAAVYLKGATPTDKAKDSLQVSAVFTGDAKEEALKLKPGDTVTYTGRFSRFKVAIANNDWTLLLTEPKLVK